MATSSAGSNPYANLTRNLSNSKLAATAIDKNLSNRVSTMFTGGRGVQQAASREAAIRSSPAASHVVASKTIIEASGNHKKFNPFSSLVRKSTPIILTGDRKSEVPHKVSSERKDVTQPEKKKSMFGVMENDAGDMRDASDRYDDYPSSSRAEFSGKKKTEYSDQQRSVIECNDKIIVVRAFAGCGKTTTAQGYADHRPKERILYMCLNKANAQEAQARFGSNVVATTTHSVAWRAMKPNKERITNRFKPILLVDQMGIKTSRDAMIAIRILSDFFNSSDTIITEKNAKQIAYEQDLTAPEILSGVAHACLAWKRMLDPSDKLQMPHDAYLKMFALKAPKLDYETIIFDEAQDANPVTLQIVNGQPHCKLLCIGDTHQSIYQFRGSVNAMEKLSVGSTKFDLSQTWRFGPKVADIANLILGELKGEKVKLQGMGTDATWNESKVTTLSRTNAELFRIAAPIRGEGVHWVGGVDNYRLDLVMDAYFLFSRERTLIKDELMRRKFNSWDEYSKYAEDASDGEAKVMVKVVEEFTHEVPQLIEDIRKNAVGISSDANMTLTTTHKAKGIEWDFVRISNDFEVLEKAEDIASNHPGADMPIQDINLLYVGVTRAKKAVALNDETIAWIEKLPTHRSNREAAEIRSQALLNEQRESMTRVRQS